MYLRVYDSRDNSYKILVGRLVLDRCLVEAAEGIHNALLALPRRSQGVGCSDASDVQVRRQTAGLHDQLGCREYVLPRTH